MAGPPDKNRSKEKLSSEKSDKKYATLTTRSIALMAESAGYPSISGEICTILAQDICYRLRETAQASTQFMKHAKRKKLLVEDFNKALKWSDVEPIHGYGSHKNIQFKTLKEGNLFFVEEKEVDLTSTSLDLQVPTTAGKCSVKASWLALEGTSKGSSSTGTTGVKHCLSDLSDELQKYYQEVTKVILEKEAEGIKMVLNDLASNSKVSPLLPYLVSFIESGVKTVSHDLNQLTRLLQAVDALQRNNYLYLGSYVNKLIGSVTYCILEPLAVSINPLNDHWSLRVFASRLLHPLVNCCGPQPQGMYNQLLQTLKDILADSARPLCSHYGAVVSLSALGPQAIEDILVPVLPTYWQFLQPILEDNSLSSTHIREDGQKVYGAIQNAAEVLLKAKYSSLQREENPSQKSTESSSRLSPSSEETSRDTSVQETSNINELYTKFRDYLGDSLCLRLCFEGPHNSIKPNIGVVATEVSLQDLVNEKVVFNGSRFERKKERTLEDENEAKIRFLTRPPKLGGTGREGLRKRPGKAMKRQRSRSQSFKEAFPLAKNIRTYGKMNLSSLLNLPGYIEPLLPVGRSPLQEKEDPQSSSADCGK
ncbi:putative TAF6-like RNA polymerase II [Apostichopus japonicus]|uniref:Putative TAF6-like RNA polymerase II n=1 Tax=Stichopus japonicus TaxID=307972 RepID=A0A2G8LR16_STIJA|nr:putative TAF6-like RNA polymerase II [Apostichopus japonicus]